MCTGLEKLLVAILVDITRCKKDKALVLDIASLNKAQ